MTTRAATGRETKSPETVRYHRRRLLPGVELRTVFDSSRCYWFHSTGFEFFLPISWRGEIRHPRGQEILEPGSLMIARPGDLFQIQRVLEAGSWNVLAIDAELVAALGAGVAWDRIRLRPFSRLSAHLLGQFEAVVRALGWPAVDLVVANLRGFLAGVAGELGEATPGHGADVAA